MHLQLIRLSSAFALCAGFAVPSPLWAQENCDAFQPSPQNTVSVAPTIGAAEFCTQSRDMSGSLVSTCGWAFDYRSPDAVAAFDAMNAQVSTCFPKAINVGQDGQVNHPDYFDQRLYQVDGTSINVSLKDKGALQKTYVFVAVQVKDEG